VHSAADKDDINHQGHAMTEDQNSTDHLAITADIVASYLSNNLTAPADIPALIKTVYQALQVASSPNAPAETQSPLKPAISIKRSVQDDFIVSLEDGKKYKTLKRHLAGLGMTPNDYRTKWSLSKDYPMVAPSYARRRSELAKASGLGQQARKAEPEPAPAPPAAKKARPRKKATA
jgi:predicted transcriptional regulator